MYGKKLESLESGSVIFECKEGPFVAHEVEGILEVKNEEVSECRMAVLQIRRIS